MSQPQWKLLTSTDHSAIFVDRTGVYGPEMVYGQEVDDEHYEVTRFELERFKVVRRAGKNFLVPFKWAPEWPHNTASYEPWFLDSLDAVAATVGRTKHEIIKDLTDSSPAVRARAYEDIGGHHGFNNFDHYPRTMLDKQFAAALKGRG